MKKGRFYGFFVVVVFFFFMLLHQTDRLMIGSLQIPISDTFKLDDFKWGMINSGALIIGTILYPIWGYLYDKFSRSKLLSLASFIWGATTWISSIVPGGAKNYPLFLAARASTGIDDSSYPGLYSLVADYFGPEKRGKVYGFLQLSQPLGYLIGMVLALMIAPILGGVILNLEGWRAIFLITGLAGIIMSIIIFFGIKEMPRGKAEPEFEGMEEITQFRFNWKDVKELLKKRTLWFIFLQGFVGVFPWNVITYFFFGYLIIERGYDNNSVFITMLPLVLLLSIGHFIGGALGDWLFRHTTRGRIIVSSIGVIMGAIFMFFAIITPAESRIVFLILMSISAIFMPFSAPNVVATIFDITPPEIRSSAHAIEYFIENSGAALAPVIAGAIAVSTTKQNAILTICISSWVLCFLLYLGTLFFVDKDIKTLRKQLAIRARNTKKRKAKPLLSST